MRSPAPPPALALVSQAVSLRANSPAVLQCAACDERCASTPLLRASIARTADGTKKPDGPDQTRQIKSNHIRPSRTPLAASAIPNTRTAVLCVALREPEIETPMAGRLSPLVLYRRGRRARYAPWQQQGCGGFVSAVLGRRRTPMALGPGGGGKTLDSRSCWVWDWLDRRALLRLGTPRVGR